MDVFVVFVTFAASAHKLGAIATGKNSTSLAIYFTMLRKCAHTAVGGNETIPAHTELLATSLRGRERRLVGIADGLTHHIRGRP
jgi:hypothetical protein